MTMDGLKNGWGVSCKMNVVRVGWFSRNYPNANVITIKADNNENGLELKE